MYGPFVAGIKRLHAPPRSAASKAAAAEASARVRAAKAEADREALRQQIAVETDPAVRAQLEQDLKNRIKYAKYKANKQLNAVVDYPATPGMSSMEPTPIPEQNPFRQDSSYDPNFFDRDPGDDQQQGYQGYQGYQQ
jgi:hypothetical protein